MKAIHVITTYICPPVSTTEFDWMAHMDGDEEGPTGYGPSELEAVKNLCGLLATAQAEA